MDEKKAVPAAHAGHSIPYITWKIPFYEVLGEEEPALIENNANTILEEIGIEFREDPEALSRWKAARIHAARPQPGAPFIYNLDEGRRYARIEDFRNFVKLAYLSKSLHHSGGTICEPVDLPVNKRHFDMVYSHMKYGDKAFMGSVTHLERANQACIVTPFILAGAPTFGTPEPALVLYIMANLARRLGVPFQSGGSLCASKIPDAQAAFESAQTLLPTCLAGVNFVLHVAGLLEGGLAMGYEKFVMDADQAGMMHTLANFETAFYRLPLADNNSFEQWEAEGRKDMARRANELWKKQLAEYVEPPLDPAVDEALLDYMNRRKASFPDSNV